MQQLHNEEKLGCIQGRGLSIAQRIAFSRRWISGLPVPIRDQYPSTGWPGVTPTTSFRITPIGFPNDLMPDPLAFADRFRYYRPCF